MHDGHDDNTCY